MFTSAYEAAIDQCYEAVASPELWPTALDALARTCGATAAMFYPKDVNENATLVPSSSVYGELLEDYVAGNWFENHYRAERGWPLLMTNGQTVILEHDLATDEERRRLPHYNELYLRWGFPGFAAIGFMCDGNPWCLPLIRNHGQGFFTPEEATRLEELQPHLKRMVRLSGLFGQGAGRISLETFDAAGHAALLIDTSGGVMAANALAESLLERNAEHLTVRRGRIAAGLPAQNARLQGLVAKAAARNLSAADPETATPFYLQRPGRSPISLETVTPPAAVRMMSSRAAAVILLRDLDERRKPDGQALRDGLGLTAAEARLCSLLMEDMSVSEAGDRLGITEGTARQRLKAVLQKTGTRRQGELMLLLSRF